MKNTSIRTITYAASTVGAAIILIAAFVAVRYASTTQQISQINQSENTFDAALINRLTQRKIPFQRVAMNDKGEAWIVLSS